MGKHHHAAHTLPTCRTFRRAFSGSEPSVGSAVEWLEPESDVGNVEYKLRLKDSSTVRFQQLVRCSPFPDKRAAIKSGLEALLQILSAVPVVAEACLLCMRVLVSVGGIC